MYLRAALTTLAFGILSACDAPTQSSGSQSSGTQASGTRASAPSQAVQAEQRRQSMARFYGPRGGSR